MTSEAIHVSPGGAVIVTQGIPDFCVPCVSFNGGCLSDRAYYDMRYDMRTNAWIDV
jgi:hypothetical protein